MKGNCEMNEKLRIVKVAAEAAVLLTALKDITSEEAEIIAWLVIDELLLLKGQTRIARGGDADMLA